MWYARKSGRLEHITIVERALGHKLPRGAEVHHINEDKRDNSLGNLVACQSSGYHKLLHQRTRALMECGNPNWRKCPHCGKYDDPNAMKAAKTFYYHPECNRTRALAYYYTTGKDRRKHARPTDDPTQ